MLFKRTITIFVMGNSPKSLKSVEIGNRTIKAFWGERQHVSALRERPEASEPAVYLLLSDPKDGGLTKLYVGETDDSSERILRHANDSQKDWWERFLVFTGKNLTKAHVRYLEREVFLLAKKSTAIQIMNSPKSEPGGTFLPEHSVSEMQEYLSDMLFLLETLELGYFDTYAVQSKGGSKDDANLISSLEGQRFRITLSKDLTPGKEQQLAYMEVLQGAYILKKGSSIRAKPTDKFQETNPSYFQLWKKIVESDAVENGQFPELLLTTRDLEFRSPSAAGAIVRARSTNGRQEWLRETDHLSLQQCQTSQV
jgi:hypothetical protein